jgi:hypothetical protein
MLQLGEHGKLWAVVDLGRFQVPNAGKHRRQAGNPRNRQRPRAGVARNLAVRNPPPDRASSIRNALDQALRSQIYGNFQHSRANCLGAMAARQTFSFMR